MEVDLGNQQLQESATIPDLMLPTPDDIVIIERHERVEYSRKSRWLGSYWIHQVRYRNGDLRWIKETPEEGTYEEIEDQPSEEPIQATSGAAGSIS